MSNSSSSFCLLAFLALIIPFLPFPFLHLSFSFFSSSSSSSSTSSSIFSPLIFVSADVYASSLTFQIEPRDEACFSEELIVAEQFRLDFEVIRGGLLDIKLKVLDPYGQTIQEKMAFFNRNDDALNEAEGRVQFAASQSGTYKICFDNTMSRWTAKVVSFFIVDKSASQTAKEELAKLEHLGPVVDSVIKIADTLDDVENNQHHLRVKEQSHRDTTDNTNARVSWLSFMEAVILIGATLFQLQYVQSWFKETSKPGRV